jgi:hypothetical protein
MAIFLSPGVFPREIDLSILPTSTSGVVPAFIGTAKKGPVNVVTFVSSAQNFIDTFGEPFVDSNLGYSVLAYMEEGNAAYILRIGVECEDGQADELASICIDTSGGMVQGWGRIPVFSGIDYGRIQLRVPSTDEPFVFHPASTDNQTFADVNVSTTDGETVADLTLGGSYIGAIDDAFSLVITVPPTVSSGSVMDGAEYEIVRQSDGAVISSGVISESSPGVSDSINVGSGTDDSGVTLVINVTGSSPLEEGDTFTFEAHPDNRHFKFAVEGDDPATFTMPTTSYTDIDTFVSAFNGLLNVGHKYLAVNSGGVLYIRTETAGQRIQLVGSNDTSEPDTEGFALEVGVTKWTYDIPRSYVLGDTTDNVNISSQNNRIDFISIGGEESVILSFSLPVSSSVSIQSLAVNVDAGGTSSGTRFFNGIALQVTDTLYKLLVVTTADNQLDQLKLLADGSHIESVRFADTMEIPYPYTRMYRRYSDSRVIAPAEGSTTSATPLSCEADPSSDECALDTAYFAGLVGYIVAKSPGTWVNSYKLSLSTFNNTPGAYTIIVSDAVSGITIDRTDNVTFNPADERYIANVVNSGSSIGGQNGNPYVQWVERPSFIGADEVREPGLFNNASFSGAANGIPTSASFSSELDAAIIGNPALSTGLFAFQNPESIDISHVAVPGNSSGAVIGQMLQLCESRGDCLAIIDPPFGLRPQQVVDWHNGILLSDLASAINSSYGALYWSWLKVFDQFSSQEIFIPPSGHVLSVFARTERVAESWFAPAGLNRGRLTTVLDVEFNPTQGERDLLYGFNNAVNPIVKFPQDGIAIWGQRTLQRKDSALDRVNVRMLLIHLKKQLIPLLRNFLFEPNDEFLRSSVRSAVNITLGDVAGRRGVTGFKVVCDESNNTPDRVDRNELWVDVYIRPTKAAEFIVLNLVVLRSDQSFRLTETLAAAGLIGA